MNEKIETKIDLKDFIPEKIQSGLLGHVYPLQMEEQKDCYSLFFLSTVRNQVGCFPLKKKYSATIKKSVSRTLKTFEILGLLQGEMSKTYNKTIVFCNCEPNLNRDVMDWFNDELDIRHSDWHWYIKLNLNNPEDTNYQKEIEEKVINYWLKETKISSEMRYPTTVSYIKNTKHKELEEGEYGTLIIEYKSQIISEVIKNFVKKMTYERILCSDVVEIKAYMRGIIAAESCIELHEASKHYRVLITACQKEERDIYQKCLEKLSIESKQYNNYKDIVISRRYNMLSLLELDLMSFNPTKFKKFQELISCYSPDYSEIKEIKEEPVLYALT